MKYIDGFFSGKWEKITIWFYDVDIKLKLIINKLIFCIISNIIIE